jgi:hypothetical protein
MRHESHLLQSRILLESISGKGRKNKSRSPEKVTEKPTALFAKAERIVFDYGEIVKDKSTPFYYCETPLVPVGPNEIKIGLRQFVSISEAKTNRSSRYHLPNNIDFIVQEGDKEPIIISEIARFIHDPERKQLKKCLKYYSSAMGRTKNKKN